MILSRGDDSVIIPVDHPSIGTGWWGIEHDGAALWRWTDGNASILLESDTQALLRITLAAAPEYPVSATPVALSRQAA
jgi:hypothetical protein